MLQPVINLIQNNRIAEALTLCEQISRSNKKNLDAWLLLADIYQRSGALNKAENSYRKVLKIKASHTLAHTRLAMLYHGQRRFSKAEPCYQQSLKLDNNQPTVRFNLGAVLQEQGKLDDAVSQYRQAIKLKPDYAKAYANLGFVLRKLKKYDDAINSYQQALQFAPDVAEIHYNLGLALNELNRYTEAEICFNKSIELNSMYTDAYIALADLKLSAGIFDKALKICESANEIIPNNHDLLSHTGYIFSISDDMNKAVKYLEKANKIEPSNPRTLYLLSNIYYSNDKINLALNYAGNALQSDSDNSAINHLLGKIHKRLGNYDAALKYFKNALISDQENESIIADTADILEIRGEYDNALALIKPFIARKNVSHNFLNVYSALSHHFNTQSDAIVLMEEYIQNHDILSSTDIHRELGKHYDKNGQYDNAIAHYHLFNNGLRLTSEEWIKNYNAEDIDKEYETWVQNYQNDFWKSISSSLNQSERPVFVIGMPRSGTSLVEQILSSHPKIYGAGELEAIPDIVNDLSMHTGTKQDFPEFLSNISMESLNASSDRYLNILSKHNKTASRVIDKMPMNFWYLGLISVLFPKAKIIHIQRHPLDTCLSIYFQRFGASMPFTTNLTDIGKYYKVYNKLMKYWKRVLDIQILEIKYDDLVFEPDANIRNMVKYCGLDWSHHCLEFYKNDRDVNTPSYDQVRQPLYTKSSGRWENYNEHLSDLKRILDISD